MLAAMWKKEKWLKVERIIGAQSVSAQETTHTHTHWRAEHHNGTTTQTHRWRRSLEAGLDVKYRIMERCRDGTRQQQNTTALAAMIPGKKA